MINNYQEITNTCTVQVNISTTCTVHALHCEIKL